MSNSGPFGLWMGLKLEEIPVSHEEVARGKYRVKTVPRPHSAFESYILHITPGFGLSWIKAIGKTIDTNPYGHQLKSEFDSLEQRLSAVYGRSHRTDFLAHDSIWDEPRDWMMGLLNQERFLMTAWTKEHGSTMKDALVTVALLATALGSDSGYVAVEYSFENSDAADAALAAAEDDAL